MAQQDGDLCTALTRTVSRRATELLSRESDGSSKGWRRYNEWEHQKWKQQHYEYYDDALFRACYAISKLPWSVGISTKALEAVAAADAAAAQRLLDSSRAVCVGCGPGSDAIALLGRRQRSRNPNCPLVVHLVDRCSGWWTLVASVDEHLRECRLPFSLWFKPGCVKDADGAGRLLPDADLVVLSFAHSVNADSNLWPHLAARYKMVLVIDITSEALADTLQQAGFTTCHIDSQSAVSVFFHVAAKSKLVTTEDSAAAATDDAVGSDAVAADDAVGSDAAAADDAVGSDAAAADAAAVLTSAAVSQSPPPPAPVVAAPGICTT